MHAAFRGRTPSRRLTLGMRFRFLLDLLALLDRFVAMVIDSFDLVCTYLFDLLGPGGCPTPRIYNWATQILPLRTLNIRLFAFEWP